IERSLRWADGCDYSNRSSNRNASLGRPRLFHRAGDGLAKVRQGSAVDELDRAIRLALDAEFLPKLVEVHGRWFVAHFVVKIGEHSCARRFIADRECALDFPIIGDVSSCVQDAA